MNVIICCGGTMMDGRTEATGIKGINHRSKCDYLLIKETILERMVRLLRAEGLTDITVAYAFLKPKAEDVSFRKVKYRQGKLSTLLQCRDLFSKTLIMNGDIVFSKWTLKEFLNQPVNKILLGLMGMTLLDVEGSEILRRFFDKHEIEFMSESMGQDYQHYLRCLGCIKFPNELGRHMELFIGSHFICDCDGPLKCDWIRNILKKYSKKGIEPQWRNGWQQRVIHFPSKGPWIIRLGAETP